ncbi:MAG: hypothetical protein V3V31_08155 [Methylococcales bacterium]
MIEKSDSKWVSLVTASILGQAPSRSARVQEPISKQRVKYS